MEVNDYISNEERIICKKVIDAFCELYEMTDTLVLDAGKYGFILCRYYDRKHGFIYTQSYTHGYRLFNALWEAWLDMELYRIAKESHIEEIHYEQVYDNLNEERRQKLAECKNGFAKNAGIELTYDM